MADFISSNIPGDFLMKSGALNCELNFSIYLHNKPDLASGSQAKWTHEPGIGISDNRFGKDALRLPKSQRPQQNFYT
jgi:hypothetical protein